MPYRPRAVLAVALLALAACGGSGSGAAPAGSATMRPGEDCLGCHREFTAAGTVYASGTAAASQGLAGVQVTIHGSVQVVPLTTNAAGNFYTTVSFGYGPDAYVEVAGAGQQMLTRLGSSAFAGCNSCHTTAAALGRVHVP